MTEPIHKGIVKWFSAEKGFGYAVGEDQIDRHFRVSDVVGPNLPRTGQHIEFMPIQRPKGPGATSVTLIDAYHDSEPGNGRILCPSCDNLVPPRIVTYQGQAARSLCPVCGYSLREFKEHPIEWLWRVLSLRILLIGGHIETILRKLFR